MKLFYLSFILYFPYILCENGYKYCVSKSVAASQKCLAVQKGNSQVACVPVIDSADCAIKLIDKKAHFGVFYAEDAYFVSPNIDGTVEPIGQLRHKSRLNEQFAFETVVVVRKDHSGGFGGLRSTNYCHPGFGDGQFWTDRVLKEFEAAVVPRMCNANMSNAQLEMLSLAEFFKSACRPGQWSFDDMLDKKLKRKFPTLCSLCDSPARCAYNEDLQGSHKEALTCLTENGGDVAYVALEFVVDYFGLKFNISTKGNPDPEDYKFLCPDGTYQSLRNPCSWVKQPWPVVVAIKEKAAALKTSIVNDFLCKSNECRGKWQEAFTLLLEGNSHTFFPASSKDETLLKYLSQGRKIPREREEDPCANRSVRLCTTNAAEYSKCTWLKQAVISQGIEPRLQCVPSYNLWSCFDLIKKRQADVIGIDSEYTFIAKKIFNLSTVMYQDNNNDVFYLILPIIKADSSIKSFSDFKNKRISFPEYNGLAWNTFVTSVKKRSLLPKKCPYVNAVSEFLNGACVPGVYDINHKDFNVTVPENICSLCSNVNNNSHDKCVANSSNKYFGYFGAFSSLVDNITEIAILDYRQLSKDNATRLKEIDQNSYRILCKDGTLKPLLDYLQIGTDCAMSYGLRAEFVSRLSITESERNDIVELFLKMDDRFGARLSSSDSSIMMYQAFNETSGLIFKESTIDLIPIHAKESNHLISSLETLKSESSVECTDWKSAAAIHTNEPMAIIFIWVVHYYFYAA